MHSAQKALFISPLCRRRVSQKPVCVSVNTFTGLLKPRCQWSRTLTIEYSERQKVSLVYVN